MHCSFPTCHRDFSHSSSRGISFHRISDDNMSLPLPLMEEHGQTDWKPLPGSIVYSNHLEKGIFETKIDDQLRTIPVPDADLEICRMCLSTDSKMFSMTFFNLKEAYETLTGISTAEEEQLPRCLCSDCADRLMNCARFRRRSLRAHSVLMGVYKNHGWITVELVEAAKKGYCTMNTNSEDKVNDYKDLEKVNKLRDIERDSKHENVGPYINMKLKPEIYDKTDNNCIDSENETNIDEDRKETDAFKDQNVDACFSNAEIEISAKNCEHQDVSVSFELKTENDDINQYIINEVFNKSEVYTTRTVDTVSNSMFNEGSIKIEVPSSDYMECLPSDMSAGEDVFDDPLSIQEVKQQARRVTNTSQELNIGKIEQQSPEADGDTYAHTFRCDICPYQTDCRSKLTCHKRKHFGNDIRTKVRNYKTPGQKCMKKLPGEKPYSCDVCKKVFTALRQLRLHSKIHLDKKSYSCDLCGKAFRVESTLKLHVKTHNGEKPYSCNICNKGFGRKHNFQKHFAMHSGKKLCLCDICGRTFTRKDHLKLHIQRHSDVKPYSCDVCKKVFKTENELRCHSMSHSLEKPFICNICKKEFSAKHVLQKHLTTHTGEKPYSCGICEKAFARKDQLQSHLLIHCEGKYSCNICEKVFKKKITLRYHSMLHSGEEPYSCNICKKGFRRRDHLRVHIATHSSEKPYTCDICKISFKEKTQLRKHSTIHSGEKPFSCLICTKSFRLNYMLKKHLATHTGEKSHSCDICHKAFHRKEHLQTHLLTHSSERPYSCDICNKSFKRKQNFNTHSLLHSG